MHEKELVDNALRSLVRLTGGVAPRVVEIALGPGVDQHEAEIAWKGLTDDTSFGDTHVTWERASHLMVCEGEGHRYTSDVMAICPYCGADGVVIEPAPPIMLGHWELNGA